MKVNIILPQFFLPPDSVKLGRFITSVEQPHQNHHDPPSASRPHVLVSLRGSYTGTHQSASTSGFGSTLTSLMSAGFSKRAKIKTHVATDCVKTHALDNSDVWFDDATTLPATRAWIERAFDRGHNVYMIVGFHTIANATISQESIVRKNAGGQIQVPAGLSLAAVGVIAPLGNVIDPGVGVHQQGLAGAQTQFVGSGEQVCALEYRQIRHRWLSSKDIDKSRLSKVRQWPSMERSRDEEVGEDDIIEVELIDVQGLDDRGWDRQIVEDEVFFIPVR